MSETATKPDDSPDDEAEQRVSDEAMIEKHLTLLSEHLEAVQIFVTRPTRGDLTAMFSRGRGNWYARRGMVEDWRVSSNANTAHNAIQPDDE